MPDGNGPPRRTGGRSAGLRDGGDASPSFDSVTAGPDSSGPSLLLRAGKLGAAGEWSTCRRSRRRRYGATPSSDARNDGGRGADGGLPASTGSTATSGSPVSLSIDRGDLNIHERRALTAGLIVLNGLIPRTLGRFQARWARAVTIARDPRTGEWRNDEFSYQPNAINPQDDLSRHRFQETNRPYQRVGASDALNCGSELVQVDASTFSAAYIDIGFAFLRDILCTEQRLRSGC
jgi:hypothetical protein